MRIVIIGASGDAIQAAEQLVERGHEVVIVEADHDLVEELSETMTCGFLAGDGSKPSILREAGPDNTDVLLCLTDSDQANIIAALVGRALEFERIVLRIADSDFEPICAELKLEDVFLPDYEIARSLVNLIESRENTGMTAQVHGDLRFFCFRVTPKTKGRLADLELPEDVRVVAVTRDDSSFIPEADQALKPDDLVLVATPAGRMDELEDRFEIAREGNVGIGFSTGSD